MPAGSSETVPAASFLTLLLPAVFMAHLPSLLTRISVQIPHCLQGPSPNSHRAGCEELPRQGALGTENRGIRWCRVEPAWDAGERPQHAEQRARQSDLPRLPWRRSPSGRWPLRPWWRHGKAEPELGALLPVSISPPLLK